MTLYEAQAAAPILASVFGDAEVRQYGSEPYDYFVRDLERQCATVREIIKGEVTGE
jgi:hypothetical protein